MIIEFYQYLKIFPLLKLKWEIPWLNLSQVYKIHLKIKIIVFATVHKVTIMAFSKYFKLYLHILTTYIFINPLNPELNPFCYLLALLGAHHFLHVSRIRVKSLTLRRLMSYIYIYGAPILDVSRSHTTTQHSR